MCRAAQPKLRSLLVPSLCLWRGEAEEDRSLLEPAVPPLAVSSPSCDLMHHSPLCFADPREPGAPRDDGEDPWANSVPHDPQNSVRSFSLSSLCPPRLCPHTRSHLSGRCAGAASPEQPSSPPPFLCRKQKYFHNGNLVWDENTSDGRYVQENCKPLRVGAAVWLLEGLGAC